MSLNFNVLSAQINSLTNDNETLFVSGKGDNAKLGSAGTFGRMFRSSSSFVEGAKAFLDGIAEKYGDGIRQMAWGLAMNSHVDGKFGLTVGVAKDIMAKCEMLADMREELSVLTDPNSARACARVLLDRISEPGADIEKVKGEVRVLATLLKGAKLSPEEGAALGSALKGVTIPSEGAIAMVVLVRQSNHPLRAATPPGKLPLLLGLCRQLYDCENPVKASELGDATFNSKNRIVSIVAKELIDGIRGRVFTKIVPDKLGQLENLARHGPPTKAMIVKLVLSDDPDLGEYEYLIPYADENLDFSPYKTAKGMDFSKMDSWIFRQYLGNGLAIHSNMRILKADGSPLPLVEANAKKMLKGTIFPSELIYDNDSYTSSFVDAVSICLKSPECLSQFKIGHCPTITSKIWAKDPAKDVISGLLENSNYLFNSADKVLDGFVSQGVADFLRINAKDNVHPSFTVIANGKTQSTEIGTSIADDKSIKSLFNDALSHCKSENQKLMLGSALTQSGTMVMKNLGRFLGNAMVNEHLEHNLTEHMSRNVKVQFHPNGSVSVSYNFPKELEGKYGKIALAYNIDKNGNIKTEQFSYELPAAIRQGQFADNVQ